MLARNGGLWGTEITILKWPQINFDARTAGRTKTETGEGHIVPLNDEMYEALVKHKGWHLKKFGKIQEEWYVSPSVCLMESTLEEVLVT